MKVDLPRVTPGDIALNCYRARGFRDAALLIPGPQCYRRRLSDDFLFDESATWQSLKSILFADGPQEIYVVTEIYTTNRWALDYRPYTLPIPATYVVNVQERIHGPEIAPYFQLHHSSLSGNVRESPYQAPQQYTILASYRRVQRRELGREADWLLPFKKYNYHNSYSNCSLVSYNAVRENFHFSDTGQFNAGCISQCQRLAGSVREPLSSNFRGCTWEERSTFWR